MSTGRSTALSDSDFAKVLHHLYVMSRDTCIDDEKLAEGLMRAAVLLLAVRHGRSADGNDRDGLARETEAEADVMLRRAVDWFRRMTPNCR